RDRLLLVQPVRYPPIAELAEPMLRLAGLRINPQTNGPAQEPRYVSFTLLNLADPKQTKVKVPDQARLGAPVWSADGKQFAFTNTTPKGIELWLADAASGEARQIKGVVLNEALGLPVRWMPDGKTLLCHTVVADRGAPPAAPKVPPGPKI